MNENTRNCALCACQSSLFSIRLGQQRRSDQDIERWFAFLAGQSYKRKEQRRDPPIFYCSHSKSLINYIFIWNVRTRKCGGSSLWTLAFSLSCPHPTININDKGKESWMGSYRKEDRKRYFSFSFLFVWQAQ